MFNLKYSLNHLIKGKAHCPSQQKFKRSIVTVQSAYIIYTTKDFLFNYAFSSYALLSI